MDEYVNVRAIAFALNIFSPHSYLVDSPASLESECWCPHLRVTIPFTSFSPSQHLDSALLAFCLPDRPCWKSATLITLRFTVTAACGMFCCFREFALEWPVDWSSVVVDCWMEDEDCKGNYLRLEGILAPLKGPCWGPLQPVINKTSLFTRQFPHTIAGYLYEAQCSVYVSII